MDDSDVPSWWRDEVEELDALLEMSLADGGRAP